MKRVCLREPRKNRPGAPCSSNNSTKRRLRACIRHL